MSTSRCKVCGSSNIHGLFTSHNVHGRHLLSDETFGVNECYDCKVVFTDIAVDGRYYKKYYLDDYYDTATERGVSALLRFLGWIDALGFSRRMAIIRQYKGPGRKLLEIGAGRGDFLARLPERFEKYAVEINEGGIEHIRKHYPAITPFSQKIDAPDFAGRGKYEIIVMWHVLEHVDDPNSFFRSLKEMLDPGGILVIDIPNRDSLGFQWTRENWFHLDTPRHLFFYNEESLRKLLGRYQLQVVHRSAEPYYYFHDLSVSLFGKLKQNQRMLDVIIFILVVPLTLLIRLIVSFFWPGKAEINTYVITHAK